MEPYSLVGIIGFGLAAYSVIANDSIQTLGTFLSSNRQRPWWLLWAFGSSILCVSILYGWSINAGDVSYGRLDSIPLPESLSVWYLLAPISLMILTRLGMPVSTTFLILSIFSAKAIPSMLQKSLLGYVVAFGFGMVTVVFVRSVLGNVTKKPISRASKPYWMAIQWLTTGVLWGQWLVQDLANIYVFLPRELEALHLAFSLIFLCTLMAYVFYSRGGKIQKVIDEKTQMHDVRVATFIDMVYAVTLYIFKGLSNIPMSTTWVFLGVLAGREIGLLIVKAHTNKSNRDVFATCGRDIVKGAIGLAVSVTIALAVPFLIS